MVGRLLALHLPAERLLAHLLAAWDAGDAAVPLPLDAPPHRIRELLDRLRPHALIEPSPHGRTERTLLGSPRPVPDGTALVVATSGSTGVPKGVLLSRRALDASTAASVSRLGAVPGDRFTLALPLHHVAGLQVVLRSWRCGTDPERVADPGNPAALAATEAEHVSLVPTQLRRLVESCERGDLPAERLARWRTILVGGAPLDPALHERAAALGATIVTSYGMTETCGGCVYDGRPLDGVHIALRDDGRIRIRGPVLFSGYRDLADGEASAPIRGVQRGLDPDGWFTTGDVGGFEDGRLVVLGRHDDVIVSGGENVPAAAVTAAVLTHPAVADAAVVGVPDPDWGHRVVAVIVPADPARPPELADVRSHVADRLPPSHAPRQLVSTPAIPRDGLGKPTLDALHRLASSLGTPAAREPRPSDG
jgi:o-succinylbenzoate---CoA ligase